MYINKKLDNLMVKWRDGSYNPLDVTSYVLRSYMDGVRESDGNPFNILLIRDFLVRTQIEAEQLLDFLYVNDVKSFVLADASTALMAGLVYLLNSSSYSININQGVTWKGRYNVMYGLVIEISKKRKRTK